LNCKEFQIACRWRYRASGIGDPLIAQRSEAEKSSVNARFRRILRKRHFADPFRLKGLTGEAGFWRICASSSFGWKHEL